MRKDEEKQAYYSFGIALTIGFTMAGNVAVALFIGHMADAWLGTSPWLAVSGIIIGMISGLWSIYKKVTDRF
ncbi:hypothetical protein P22_1559 [Propionispora sp. 2/2-37]|uniref:AtpZ/AtpI family protein n=1 Tax=Propionispora sp. 2/2-37 TaxID=1677858 RepID=UPI0006BB6A8E|nr:AtpZ/AtpI family protein [Propionispora sp. 2/2-37]CUH95488.1 hypothetical protein P22_1559 [Propionispora sp. 2/2-37]